MNRDEALRKAQREICEKGPFFQTEMGQYAIQLGFEQGIEQGKNETTEKVISYLDSVLYYVSNQDRRLVCNFTEFNEFIEDLKKSIKVDDQ